MEQEDEIKINETQLKLENLKQNQRNKIIQIGQYFDMKRFRKQENEQYKPIQQNQQENDQKMEIQSCLSELNFSEVTQISLDFSLLSCDYIDLVKLIPQVFFYLQNFPNLESLYIDLSQIQNSLNFQKHAEVFDPIKKSIIASFQIISQLPKLRNLALNLKFYYLMKQGIQDIDIISNLLKQIEKMHLQSLVVLANKEQNIHESHMLSILKSQSSSLKDLTLILNTNNKNKIFYEIAENIQICSQLEHFYLEMYELFFNPMNHAKFPLLFQNLTQIKKLKSIDFTFISLQYAPQLVNEDFQMAAKHLGQLQNINSVSINVGYSQSQQSTINSVMFQLNEKEFAQQLSPQLKRLNLKSLELKGFTIYLQDYSELYTFMALRKTFLKLLGKKLKESKAFRPEKYAEVLLLLLDVNLKRRHKIEILG